MIKHIFHSTLAFLCITTMALATLGCFALPVVLLFLR